MDFVSFPFVVLSEVTIIIVVKHFYYIFSSLFSAIKKSEKLEISLSSKMEVVELHDILLLF